jgi:hypothetical protein
MENPKINVVVFILLLGFFCTAVYFVIKNQIDASTVTYDQKIMEAGKPRIVHAPIQPDYQPNTQTEN